MAYEYESKLLDYASDSKTYEEYKAMTQELQEVYRKAKILDEVKGFIIRKLKEEEEQYLIQSEQDVGQYKAYNHIDDIIQEYKERADDER